MSSLARRRRSVDPRVGAAPRFVEGEAKAIETAADGKMDEALVVVLDGVNGLPLAPR